MQKRIRNLDQGLVDGGGLFGAGPEGPDGPIESSSGNHSNHLTDDLDDPKCGSNPPMEPPWKSEDMEALMRGHRPHSRK